MTCTNSGIGYSNIKCECNFGASNCSNLETKIRENLNFVNSNTDVLGIGQTVTTSEFPDAANATLSGSFSGGTINAMIEPYGDVIYCTDNTKCSCSISP